MTTVRDIIAQAYRKVGFGVDAPTGDEFLAGVDAFNNMIHAWKLRGVNIFDREDTFGEGFPDPSLNDKDFGENDTFPMPLAFREGTVYCLAARLAPEYTAPVTWDEDAFFRAMQGYYQNVNAATFDPELLWQLPVRRSILR